MSSQGEIRQGFFVAVDVLPLSFLALARAQFAKLGKANLRQYETFPLPVGVVPPAITLLSPEKDMDSLSLGKTEIRQLSSRL
jgi:hypothetical protein